MAVCGVFYNEAGELGQVKAEVEGGLSGLVAALRSVQKETNTLLTQEIERQGGSGDVEDENEEDDDESEEEKEPEIKVAKLQ